MSGTGEALPRARRAGRLVRVADGVPILGVTGVNGTGKTCIAVTIALGDMARGRPVYSTVPVEHPVYGRSRPLVSLRQLLELDPGSTILLDDIAAIFSSRTTQAVPPEVVTLMHTLRHKDQRMIWTAPGWMRADVNVRLATQACLNVVRLVHTSVPGTPWPRTRVAFCGLLDTTEGKPDSMPERTLRRRLVRLGGLAGFGAYDTHAPTPQIGGHVHSGVCPDCGGTRSRPKHSAELHESLGLPWFEDDPRASAAAPSGADTLHENSEAPA